MKYLLNGVILAAAFAIASPVWAQSAPMSPSTPPKPAMAAPAKPMAAKPMAQQRHHRMMAHKGRMWHHARSADSVTDQLNKEELARIQGGPGPAPGGMPMMPPPPPPQIGPRPSGH